MKELVTAIVTGPGCCNCACPESAHTEGLWSCGGTRPSGEKCRCTEYDPCWHGHLTFEERT
jgi:hypothetical protein